MNTPNKFNGHPGENAKPPTLKEELEEVTLTLRDHLEKLRIGQTPEPLDLDSLFEVAERGYKSPSQKILEQATEIFRLINQLSN